ncbi:cellulose biosynthesis protein BcsQ [Erwinia sp. MMLR14_017]|uniref:cellulose biosynthesis protein BcsQ n=1 Tax=Erwinia sp. MMLR14_017 TaxID=3093842 RepID=UPI00298FEF57|nr:cellulose biosynthesis protein BcsQ [Erwinia sp. MMLR14_017]MDW8845117.1 cellulose biosynthesis protein BcsQ [Erwinia sp. MMLR14_017]
MPVIALQGVRGGAGTTSLTAAFAWALQTQGESVVVVDLSPDNQLRLHFNTPATHPRGWLRAALDDQPWQQSALRYAAGLDFIPFGQINDRELLMFVSQPLAHSDHWAAHLAELRQAYRWILLDVPAGTTPWTRSLLTLADRVISVVVPDANCHIRLHQQRFAAGNLFLLNQYSPLINSQQDLHQLWLSTLDNLIPLSVHRDEAVAEALLNKQPFTEYRPQSLAAEEMMTFASWALINLRGLPA